jgi:hypothetical protein
MTSQAFFNAQASRFVSRLFLQFFCVVQLRQLPAAEQVIDELEVLPGGLALADLEQVAGEGIREFAPGLARIEAPSGREVSKSLQPTGAARGRE